MPNKANKSSKKGKSPTANAEVNLLPKEPLSVLAVAVVTEVVAEVVAILRALLKRKVVVTKRVLQIRRVVQRKVQVKMIRQQLTGLKLT